MMRSWAVFVIACMAGPASAGPWVREKGEAYARLAVSHERLEGISGQRLDLYGEYGLNARWTLTGKVEGVRYEGGFPGREGYRLTVRRGLISWKNFRLAVEGGLVGGEALGGQGGCEAAGAELRMSAGGNVTLRERQSFVFVDVAQREHGGCARSRLEAGIGQELAENWTILSQVWVEQASGDSASDSIKTEIALNRDIGSTTLGIGFREEVSNDFNENAVVIAVSSQF